MKTSYLLSAVAIIIMLVALILYLFYFSSPQVVVKGDNVSVFYTGSFTNGTVFNSNIGQRPFTFTAGTNQTIPGFDNAVLGMELNQTKNITIPVNEAYGPINPSLIVTVPLSDFSGHNLTVGSVVTSTSSTGQTAQGIITYMNSTSAIVNFNSPLAGKTLMFTIHVVNITK